MIAPAAMHESFQRHRQQPEVSPDDYFRQRSIALLDTNHWVHLRDVVLGRSRSPAQCCVR